MKLPQVPHLREYLTTLCMTMSVMSSGAHFGWASPTLPILKADDSPIKITDDEGSWIVSILLLGTIFGPIPAGFLINRVGRKNTLMLSAIPFIISWVLILVANSVMMLYIARFLAGIAHGATYAAIPLYLGEIASNEIRGACGTFMTAMSKFGILIAYGIGPFVSYNVLPYILMLPPIILLLTYFILPETPYYYLLKHQEENAMTSLKYLRAHDNITELQLELDKMNASVKSDQENKASFKELFVPKGNRKAMIIMFGCVFGQQLCGSQAVIAYAQEIFAEADGALGPKDSAIVLGVVQLVVAFTSSSIVDRMGRRPLLLASTLGVSITSAAIGGYFYVKYYLEYDVSSISWLPITAILIYIIAYTVGLATVPFALLGELFPTNVKALAAVVITMITSVFAFTVTKLYQVVSDAFGTYVTFWGFSVLAFISFILVFITLPETKGKSLVEIQFNLNISKTTENPT